jgi:hypothetical protein
VAFKFESVKADVASHVNSMVEEWAALRADWGLADGSLDFGVVNTLRIWDDLEDCKAKWEISDQAKEAGRAFPLPFQLPLVPVIEFSFGFGKERCPRPVYAIDGGDQTAYEFAHGRKGGAGLATYGWVATQDGAVVAKFPRTRELQLVPADVLDLYNFSLLTFNQAVVLSPDSLTTRKFAALRRTQLEFLQLNYLIDRVQPGTIILLDGFLKAMFTPPVRFIHEIGKKAARKGVIILGVAKSSKIDMWLHFEEYWNTRQQKSGGWIRPPAPVLDEAFRSVSGEDTNQFLYLGEKGRGVGFPIAATLSPQRKSYYVVDFNCYDFEAAKPYLNTMELPEAHAKHFPLTIKDKDFISFVLAQVAYYSDNVTCLGYPFPTAAAHKLVMITHSDVKRVRSLARSELLPRGITLGDMRDFQRDPRKILEAF